MHTKQFLEFEREVKHKRSSRLIWIVLIVLGMFVGFTESSEAEGETNNAFNGKTQSPLHIVLGMKSSALAESFMKTQAIGLKSFFDGENIIYNDLRILGDREITFELLDPQDIAKVKEVLKRAREAIPGVSFANDGLKFSFTVTKEGLIIVKNQAIEGAVKIIQNRLFGSTGSTVVRQGVEKIVVDIPELKTEEFRKRTFRLVTRQGLLQLMEVESRSLSMDEAKSFGDTVLMDVNTGERHLLRAIPIVFASKVKDATMGFYADDKAYTSYLLREYDKKRVADFTSKNMGKHIAVVLDNKVYSTSLIDGQVGDGHGQISPKDFTFRNAHNLAIVLRSGAMLAPMYVIKETEPDEVQAVGTDACKSKAFTDLQLAAVEAFQESNHKKTLELFQKAYQLCPTDEMTRGMIKDLKKDAESIPQDQSGWR